MNNENQSPVIPEINYEIIDSIEFLLAYSTSHSNISKSLNLPYEVIEKLIEDIYRDKDPISELLISSHFYDYKISDITQLINKQIKHHEDNKNSNDINSIVKMMDTTIKLTKGKTDLLEKLASNPKLTYKERKIYSPSTKQKEVLDILERLGEVDKKTIAKNLNPEVSETRVHHLMHGKNGKPGLLDLVWGVSYRKRGNKNYYKMLYKRIEE